ncbi:Probable G-protein coupled receptor 158 [Harpegnathos saltator]|uniref:Probable G-protein coupled receptor 158 n=2 Tax=Harpegnathos saltator TaxID=610380 RepID=E2B838_HARSA|nr:Probable G-protein coupled receptor 158 [Harpegnathos saltator]
MAITRHKTPVFLCCLLMGVVVVGQYEWQTRDAFDEIRMKMDKVTEDNCQIQHIGDLYLPENTVSHLPEIKDIDVNPVFPNRTALLHLQNMALSRSFFWSYILQSRFIRPAINDTYDPGMMYYFLSTVADVSANPYINASAIYFSPNMSYSPSYRGFFNKTMPKFAPRTFRADDFNDPIHLERISTRNTFTVQDLGAFPATRFSSDYSSDFYRINEWYKKWLPDNVANRHDTKTTYQVEIRYANNTNETFTFHGPRGADENPGPVKWTRPYFDCGRSNRWIVAAVVPIADIYPRHTGFRHIEYPTYTAISVLEMDFDRIDINQCPKGRGNSGPNRFANTARCKKETTECEPIHGWGFRRGGYQCRCKPGYRLPTVVRRPFLGEIVERATQEQYYNGFDCSRIGWIHKMPVQWDKAEPYVREKYLEQYPHYRNYSTGLAALHDKKINIKQAIDFILHMDEHRCKKYAPQDLELRGDISFGAEEFFENEAKMATRLANFISAFLQVSDPLEVYSGKRLADKPLTEDQMFGETLALVMGDTKIWSAGTFWDRNKFTNRTFFAPYAYKKELNTRKFKLEDLARLNNTDEVYTKKDYFQTLKQRWATNFDQLEKYYMKIKIRYNETGEYMKKFEHYPNFYRAANLDHGHWTTPYFDCNGELKKWVITYASPFFGWDSLKEKLEFKGVVAVTMNLLQVDINQCDDKFYRPNAFKGTHKCDKKTSYCVPILGRGFDTGGYKCECKQGFEYPFEDLITYYDGQLVEAEFGNIIDNNATR